MQLSNARADESAARLRRVLNAPPPSPHIAPAALALSRHDLGAGRVYTPDHDETEADVLALDPKRGVFMFREAPAVTRGPVYQRPVMAVQVVEDDAPPQRPLTPRAMFWQLLLIAAAVVACGVHLAGPR